jgi:glycosyltransferase involved in cell wall biosynthesis
MKIAYLLPDVGVAGGVLTVFETVNRLIQRGHEAFIITLNQTPQPPSWYPYKGMVLPLKDIFTVQDELDVLVATHYITAFFVNDIETKAKKYYYVQHRESLFVCEENYLDMSKEEAKQLVSNYRKYIEKTYTFSLRHITPSKWLYDMSKNEFGNDPLYIQYGLNHDIFYPEPYYDKPEGKLRVLIEGTHQAIKWKGVADAIEAVNMVEGLEVWTISADKPQFRVDQHWQDPSQENIRKIYSSADVLIKPSWYEGVGIGPMQAMACGCAVLTTDNWGCNEYAENNKNALIVPSREPKKMAKAIERLKDSELRERLIKAGLETAKTFQWEPQIDKLEKSFEENK